MTMKGRKTWVSRLAMAMLLSLASAANAQSVATPTAANSTAAVAPSPAAAVSSTLQVPDLTKRENFSAAMQIIILLTVLSLAPAILIMMTSFTRIVIVLALLRQAMGTQQLPPNQILVGLALFMTFLVMGPTWKEVNEKALQPYMDGKIDQKTALSLADDRVREFMQKQIMINHNEEDVFMMHGFTGKPPAKTWSDVSTTTLIPAFMLSELKT